MKKISLLLSIAILLEILSINISYAEEPFVHATGLKSMTAEELENFKNKIPQIIDVKLNELALERITAENPVNLMSVETTIPAELGEEIVTTESATLQTVSETMENLSLPLSVDNSTGEYFPKIGNQGNVNSCMGWSLGYYQLTNNSNRIRQQSVDKTTEISDNIYSPNWIYNLSNEGTLGGVSFDVATSVLYNYGCPTTTMIPIVSTTPIPGATADPNVTPDPNGTDEVNKCLTWYPVPDVWESAIYNRCKIAYGNINPNESETFINGNDDVGTTTLNRLKAILAIGDVVTISTNTQDIETMYSKTNEEYVWVEIRKHNAIKDVWDEGDDFDHAMTIVGYDDNFEIDINGNNSIEPGERGAFKLANSWGTDNEWYVKRLNGAYSIPNNSGYIWLSYDALNETSAVGIAGDGRIPAINNYLYVHVTTSKDYEPILLGYLTLTTKNRGSLDFYMQLDDAKKKPADLYRRFFDEPTSTDTDYIEYMDCENAPLNRSGGNFSLLGNTSESTNTIVLDYTSLLEIGKFEAENDSIAMAYFNEYDTENNKLEQWESSIECLKIKNLINGNTYSKDLSSDEVLDNEISVSIEDCVNSVPADENIVLEFNNYLLNPELLSNSFVIIEKPSGNNISITCSYNSNKKITIAPQEATFKTGFYELRNTSDITSVGGNTIDAGDITYEFYVPFY